MSATVAMILALAVGTYAFRLVGPVEPPERVALAGLVLHGGRRAA
ncbi:hypothetical protein [Streptomyces canus]